MKSVTIVRRILITLVVTFIVLFVGIYWVVPVALSFYASQKALAITRVDPINLKDQSVSHASGTGLNYLGHGFESPWADLDESQTELFPKNRPDKSMARLHFRSGLQIVLIAGRPQAFADQFTKDINMSPAAFAAAFGEKAANSDYEFMKRVLEFSPDRMHHWTLSPAVHAREQVLLLTKSIVPTASAQTGIFNICNRSYQGFQQGNPEARPEAILLDLYSSSDSFEIMFVQKNFVNPTGISQPEINGVVQSLHKVAAGDSLAYR